LLGRFQRAFVLSFLAHALDGIHNIALLRQEGISQIRRPLNIIGQTFHQIR
jgi:hypothetical protein